MKVLVTGGAGYIGSTVALALHDNGDHPILLDDLSRGQPERMRLFPCYVGDIADPVLLDRIFADHPDLEVVIHCAARTVVSESLTDPVGYYRENVAKTVRLVDELLRHGCTRLLFSSSAAVYGPTPPLVVTEETPVRPRNPYATSKLMVERLLTDICAAGPLTAVSLRYFNPVGCDPRFRSGPVPGTATHVLGTLLRAAALGEPFWIHGRDWDTPDGTPVRDFVHVWDVALAHVAAVHRWPGGHRILNVGSGRGTTIRQLAEVFNLHAQRPVEIRYDGRRAGDTVGCYTSSSRARSLLRWQPTRTVADAVLDAIAWAARSVEPDAPALDPAGGLL
ncbi:MAG TPA: UDP-glucose 4-epimerase GalE [Jatrophihabitans sp.]|nr:UDP-glucose 4-epimerase GalE [Jatrophihabitans sp.]